MVTNLLGNAVKFTPSGSITLRAHPAATPPSGILIEVTDTGPGIAEEEQSRLFSPFVQSAAGVREGGTGLGLTISRAYARLMGGDITVDSRPGLGATFTFAFTALAAPDSVSAPAPAATIRHLSPGTPPTEILVVDDNEVNRRLLVEILTSVGFTTREASDGAKALDAFRDRPPHAIFMDIRMPVMDGYEACRAIRATPGGDRVRIIALTASVFEEQKSEIISAGANDFARKPFRRDDLLHLLARQLGLTYEYESGGAQASPDSDIEVQLETLPPGVREELVAAARAADLDKLLELADSIRPVHPAEAARIESLAKQLRYDRLVQLLTAGA